MVLGIPLKGKYPRFQEDPLGVKINSLLLQGESATPGQASKARG
jgi:hypothetical protein